MTGRAILIAALLLMAGYGAGWSQQRFDRVPLAKTSSTAAGQPLEFPASPELTAYTVALPASTTNAPFHKHPYQRLVYVLDGKLSVEREGGDTQEYPAGALLVEMREFWH